MNKTALNVGICILFLITILIKPFTLWAQPILETGGQKPMPNEWIDKDTHHKVMRLSGIDGNSVCFYFHNNPFLKQTSNEGDRMIFYNTGEKGTQAYSVNLKTFKIEQVTNFEKTSKTAEPAFDRNRNGHNGEALDFKSHNLYYQLRDSVFVTNVDTKKTRLISVFPKDFNGGIFTLNADETMLAGMESAEADAILKINPNDTKRLFDAHPLHTLFTVNIKTGELKKIHQEKNYLNHIQFSTTDPNLLMFCREGPWDKVDRIWTVNIKTSQTQLMYKRVMDAEIAGHEFFSPDGKTIWFDDQIPRSENFFLTGSNVNDLSVTHYRLTRDEWSIHFNISPDQKLFAGDGGNEAQVAKAKDGMWIYLFRPNGDHFDSERLVNMKNHNYKLEPNVHFSPSGKWIIFRANFEGKTNVYAVEIDKSKV